MALLPSNMSDRISSLSHAQEHILTFLPLAPAAVSIASSSILLYLVYSSGFSTSYDRILFGLSVADITTCIAISLQPFLVPAGTSQQLWAVGNDATCSLLGALGQLALSAWFYTAVLSYYYLFTIRFGMTETVFARRYEPWMHAVAIGLPVATALTGVGMDAYGEVDLDMGCWIVQHPKGCSQEEGECMDDTGILGWLFSGMWGIMGMIAILSIVIINVVIYRHVKQYMTRGSQRSLNATQQTNRTKQVAVQSFLYVAAFVGAFVCLIVIRIMDRANFGAEDEAQLFPLFLLNALLLPSNGFFNLGIYLRPRYMRTRTKYPNESVLWAIRRSLYGESITPTTTTALSRQHYGLNPQQQAVVVTDSRSGSGTENIANPPLPAPNPLPVERVDPPLTNGALESSEHV